jgi:tellurite resistance protein TehA-like permease
MEHLVYYDIAAAFVLLTALVAYHLRKYSDNFQSRVYRVMLYALLVVSTSDFLLFWEEITFGKTGTTVLLYICILGQVVAAAAYLLYILCLTGRVERFIRKEKEQQPYQ